MLRESIEIDKWSIGNKVAYMDLEIFKLHQKQENKFLYLPYHSALAEHSVNNYVVGKLNNTKEINFLCIKVKFYKCLLERDGNLLVCSIK